MIRRISLPKINIVQKNVLTKIDVLFKNIIFKVKKTPIHIIARKLSFCQKSIFLLKEKN